MTIWKLTMRFKTHDIVHYYTHATYAHASYHRYCQRVLQSERPAFKVEEVFVHDNITEI